MPPLRPLQRSRPLILLTVTLAAFVSHAGWARTWYVSGAAAAPHDGTSWQTAFATPGDALHVARVDDEIWCQAGTYSIASTVAVPTGVTLRGGFSGHETAAADREHVLTSHATVLRQETPGEPVLAVTAAQRVVIDGITVTGARGAPALRLDRCDASVTVRQCAVVGNSSDSGVAGIAVLNGSRPTFFACRIADNKAFADSHERADLERVAPAAPRTSPHPGAAAGLWVDETSCVTCEACVFSGNRTAAPSGGAVVTGSRAGLVNRFLNCDFYFNEAATNGSAIATRGEIELRDTIVCSNRAGTGAAPGAAVAVEGTSAHVTLAGKSYVVGNVRGDNGAICAPGIDFPGRCTSRDDALVADQTGAAEATLWTQRNDVHLSARDLFLPPLTSETPAPGKWVKQTLPSRARTAAYHCLYLPTDWQPGRTFPVLVGFPGNGPFRNRYGDRSGGMPEDNDMAFGISGGRGYIILALGYLDSRRNLAPAQWWWGDVEATVAYCRDAVASVCHEYGGDRSNVILTGFSRSAIGVSFIGLHDDTIARLWRAFICYDGWEAQKDMTRDWYKFGKSSFNYDPADFGGTGVEQRFRRVAGRPVFILGGRGEARELNEKCHFPVELVDKPHRNHNTSWATRDTPERAQVRAWLQQVLASPARPDR